MSEEKKDDRKKKKSLSNFEISHKMQISKI